jgi:hypothetical protein
MGIEAAGVPTGGVHVIGDLLEREWTAVLYRCCVVPQFEIMAFDATILGRDIEDVAT